MAEPPVRRPEPGANRPWQLLSERGPWRSQQLRLLFHFAGIGFEDRILAEGEEEACKGERAGDLSPLPFDLLPAVVHGGDVVSTVAGAMQYVAEHLELGGAPGVPRNRALMAVIGCEAMRNEAFFPALEKIVEAGARVTNFPTEAYVRWFGHFERLLRTSNAARELGGPFLLGRELCFADLALYDCCTAVIDLGCYGRDEGERAQKFPRLCALLKAVEAQAQLSSYGRPHAEALRAAFGELPPPPAPKQVGSTIWEVVGGVDTGGLLVRAEKSTASKAEEKRLSTGALVKELQVDGERLQYERMTGTGPDKGWVSISVKGKELLCKTVKRPLNPPMKGRELPPPPAEGAWRVLYYENPGRGQQVRLLFHYAKRPFEDKRLTDEEVQYYKSRFARDDSPLAFDFVPIVQHGGCNICTTAGALQYAAETFGIGAGDAASRAKMVMVVTASELMRNQVVYPVYMPMRKRNVRIGYWDPSTYHYWFGHFERFMRNVTADLRAVGAEAGPFIFGSKLCYADLVLYDCLSYVADLGCFGRDEAARAEQYPLLCGLVEAVERQPSMASYGRPHGEDLARRVGTLPEPRSPLDPAPNAPPLLSRREVLSERLEKVDLRLAAERGGPSPSNGKRGDVEVVIGTPKLIEEHPGLVEHLSHLINSSYEESVQDNPARKGHHKSVSPEEVHGRLSIGDNGTRNNRVLHVAFLKGRVAGCISSSILTPWTPAGVGHWGLLAVDTALQGKGVASALVASAMHRLEQQCDEAHIEYYNTVGHAYSERLKSWYEAKLGFKTTSASPVGPSTTFRVGRRKFTQEEQQRGRRARLLEERAEISAELASVDGDVGPRCREIFARLRAYVQSWGVEVAPTVGAAYQFHVEDVGPEGHFFVDLRPGMCCAWHGVERTADCTVRTADADLEPWLLQQINGDHGFWSGRCVVDDDRGHAPKLFWLYGEACGGAA